MSCPLWCGRVKQRPVARYRGMLTLLSQNSRVWKSFLRLTHKSEDQSKSLVWRNDLSGPAAARLICRIEPGLMWTASWEWTTSGNLLPGRAQTTEQEHAVASSRRVCT